LRSCRFTNYLKCCGPLWLFETSSMGTSCFELVVQPLLGRTRSLGKCWAAIRLSHRPEPSGHTVHGEIDRSDIGGQHGRRFVLLRHTHRLQRRPYPICTSRRGNVRHRCGGGWAGPSLFLGGSFREGGCRCLELKCGVLWGCPSTPHSIGDPPTAPHVCCCQMNWWVVMRRVQMGVSIWDAVRLHSMDGERWVEQMSRLHGTAR